MMSGQSVASAAAQQRMITLSELRVFELKQELEKRGLDKNGIKFALIERLEAVSAFSAAFVFYYLRRRKIFSVRGRGDICYIQNFMEKCMLSGSCLSIFSWFL